MSKRTREPTLEKTEKLNRKIFSLRQAAREMGRSIYFLREEITRKRIAHLRLGNRIFFAEEDLTEYLARCRIAASRDSASVAKTSRKEVA